MVRKGNFKLERASYSEYKEIIFVKFTTKTKFIDLLLQHITVTLVKGKFESNSPSSETDLKKSD
jgi:hypothetical protein